MFGLVMPVTAITIVVAGMLYLAVADILTREVDDRATLILALLAVVGLHLDGISGVQWVWAGLSGLLVFLAFLELGTMGKMGGGDVKLGPIPAAVIGAINPLLAIWSVACSISIQSGLRLVNRHLVKETAEEMPFVPAMVMGTWIAAVFGLHLFAAI